MNTKCQTEKVKTFLENTFYLSFQWAQIGTTETGISSAYQNTSACLKGQEWSVREELIRLEHNKYVPWSKLDYRNLLWIMTTCWQQTSSLSSHVMLSFPLHDETFALWLRNWRVFASDHSFNKPWSPVWLKIERLHFTQTSERSYQQLQLSFTDIILLNKLYKDRWIWKYVCATSESEIHLIYLATFPPSCTLFTSVQYSTARFGTVRSLQACVSTGDCTISCWVG